MFWAGSARICPVLVFSNCVVPWPCFPARVTVLTVPPPPCPGIVMVIGLLVVCDSCPELTTIIFTEPWPPAPLATLPWRTLDVTVPKHGNNRQILQNYRLPVEQTVSSSSLCILLYLFAYLQSYQPGPKSVLA